MKLLVIEDDPEIRQMLQDFLESEGYTIITAADGETACARFAEESFDLVLLDLMLPKRSGTEVLRTIRNSGSTVPVLILSARDSDSDITLGLGIGADDYITKPFSVSQVLARIKASIRRSTVYTKAPDAPPAVLSARPPGHGLRRPQRYKGRRAPGADRQRIRNPPPAAGPPEPGIHQSAAVCRSVGRRLSR